jgi:hypothetical protein
VVAIDYLRDAAELARDRVLLSDLLGNDMYAVAVIDATDLEVARDHRRRVCGCGRPRAGHQ